MITDKTIKLFVVSMEEEIFSGEVASVIATSVLGELGIVHGHNPLIAVLKAGMIRYTDKEGNEAVLYSSGGILEVQPHTVTVLSDTAIRAADLDEAKAQQAIQHAEQEMQDSKGKIDYANAHAELIQAAAQLRTIRHLRGKK